jgi:argininosuccinate lyase
MQEDKEPLFDTVDTVKSCLEVLGNMLPKIRFNKRNIKKSIKGGFLIATDIAEYLVYKGMPFRDAHGVTGRIVKYCIDEQKDPEDMGVNEFRKFSKIFDEDIKSFISIRASVNGKKSYGSTSGKLVRNRLKAIRRRK